MLQHLAVALIVLGAALYSGWTLMPAGLRRAAAVRIARQVRRAGVADGTAARLQAQLAAKGGCSDCDSCRACGPTPAPRADGLQVVAMPQRSSSRR